MTKINAGLLIVISWFQLILGQKLHQEFTGPYMGQKPPGLIPELFAVNFISTNNTEWAPTFTTDGLECYYSVQGVKNYNHIVSSKCVNGVWQKPEFASFTNSDHNADPFISPDGKKLFFWSNRAAGPNEKAKDNSDIWYVERIGDDWGTPIRLDSTINTNNWQIFPTVSLNGNLYFSCNYPDSKGDFDIYKSEFVNGNYTKPVNLGDSLNTQYLEQEPYIAQDESYIIFCSDRHAPKSNRWDLYISFKRNDGTWSKAINMGSSINSFSMDQTPQVTADGKYFFFSISRAKVIDYTDKNFNYQVLLNALNSSQNGNSDVYWVDTSVIEEFRKIVFNKK